MSLSNVFLPLYFMPTTGVSEMYSWLAWLSLCRLWMLLASRLRWMCRGWWWSRRPRRTLQCSRHWHKPVQKCRRKWTLWLWFLMTKWHTMWRGTTQVLSRLSPPSWTPGWLRRILTRRSDDYDGVWSTGCSGSWRRSGDRVVICCTEIMKWLVLMVQSVSAIWWCLQVLSHTDILWWGFVLSCDVQFVLLTVSVHDCYCI